MLRPAGLFGTAGFLPGDTRNPGGSPPPHGLPAHGEVLPPGVCGLGPGRVQACTGGGALSPGRSAAVWATIQGNATTDSSVYSKNPSRSISAALLAGDQERSRRNAAFRDEPR